MNKKLIINDFCEFFNCTSADLPKETLTIINRCNWEYQEIEGCELNGLIESAFERVVNKGFTQVKNHDSSRWEKGWGENLEEFKKSNHNFNSLMPKYIRPDMPIRLNGKFIKTFDKNFEHNWYSVLRDWFFRTELKDFDCIYEFGSGSGHNIAELAKIYPNKKIYGFDWVQPSVDIILDMRDKLNLNVDGSIFNFFMPDFNLEIKPNSAIITMGALEQTGNEYKDFFDFLMQKKPAACFHFEPIYEHYNKNILFDYLAARAHEEKNFWKGAIPFLKDLESNKKVKINKSRRISFGSLALEGYSQLFWKPL
jgi:hypothetical protein